MQVCGMRRDMFFAFQRFIRFRHGKGHTKCASTINQTCYFYCPIKKIDKSLRDRKPQSESVRIGCRGMAFKRTKDTGKCLLTHTNTGIHYFHDQQSIEIVHIEIDCAGLRELNCIGKQIVYNLFYAVCITI